MALSAATHSRKVRPPNTVGSTASTTFFLTQSTALWVADNFVPVGGGDAITAVGYKSELANNVTVRYSFFSYNRSLDVSVGPFSPLEPGIDSVHPSCFLTSSNVPGGCRRQLHAADDALVPQVLSRHHHLALAFPVHCSLTSLALRSSSFFPQLTS